MSNFPKFILGDNTDMPNAMFVVHLEYPRFVLNLDNDEVEWLEEFNEVQGALSVLEQRSNGIFHKGFLIFSYSSRAQRYE